MEFKPIGKKSSENGLKIKMGTKEAQHVLDLESYTCPLTVTVCLLSSYLHRIQGC